MAANPKLDDLLACARDQYADIPESMKNAQRWIVWRAEPHPDPTRKPRKVPYYVSGSRRNGTLDSQEDQAQMATYETAVTVQATGKYTGLGFCLGPDGTGNYWQGIDLDNIADHLGLSIISGELPGYTESSPSGTGRHAIGYGRDFASIGSGSHGIEAYAKARYFTVTGEEVGIGDVCCLAGFVESRLIPIVVKDGGKTHQDDHADLQRVHVDQATIQHLRSALNHLEADDYHLWIEIGHALKSLGTVGRGLWIDWSQTSEKWNSSDAGKWKTFTGDKTSYEAVFAKAQRAGWLNPAAKTSRPEYPHAEEDQQPGEIAANDPIAFPDPFPGFMATVCQAGLDTAIIPQPHLTTLSTLMGMASCCGGKYHLPDGMRLNLYGVGIAASGWGKEHARKVGCAVADAGGADVKGRPGSGQGMEDLLTDHCSLLLEIDEVAHLFEALNGKVKAPHLIELSGGLLRLFSASADVYRTRVLAVAKGIPKPRAIQNPCVSLMGFSTPEKLGEVLTTMNIEDGLMGRVLFAHGVGGIRPGNPYGRFNIGSIGEVATSVAEANAYQISIEPFSADLTTHTITIDTQAGLNLRELQLEFWEAQESSQTMWGRVLMVRSFEKAKRIAGVLAVWDQPIHPVIRPDHVQWAGQMVKASNQTCADFVAKHMHGGRVSANAEKLMDYVKRILKGEFRYIKSQWRYAVENESFVPLAMLLRQCKMDKPDFDLSISHLIDAEKLVKHDKYDRWVKPC